MLFFSDCITVFEIIEKTASILGSVGIFGITIYGF